MHTETKGQMRRNEEEAEKDMDTIFLTLISSSESEDDKKADQTLVSRVKDHVPHFPLTFHTRHSV